MTSVDEPIFEEEESGPDEGTFELPSKSLYIGAVAEQAIPPEMPTLYLDIEVAKRLQEEGQRSIRTDKEVAGILLGTTSRDRQAIKVSHIAVARDEDSSPVHFKFTYTVWDDLIDQMERLSRSAGAELLLLGWYHTHPNMSVFLSRYDLRTHRDFDRPYQFALVLAPRIGTRDTALGFFCNRGGETPLVPGIRVFGAPDRKEVTGALPWRFQLIEAEGIEEGEAKPSGDAEEPVDDTPVLQQLGVVRMEDPDWLKVGVDKVEGPVLTILEGMAAAVVQSSQDRLGVLLGAIGPNNHVTINRVRFLGHLGIDPEREREELVGSLRFMAQTFPASGEQKIVGVVRIVSPHRFHLGDRYDPTVNNIKIAQMLGEVGYDLDRVPFQVGLVIYPGIEEETLFFQVFAQHKSSKPLPLMSLQAIAPPSLRANERYEPVGEAVFQIDREPCMRSPGVVPPSTIGLGAGPREETPGDSVDEEAPSAAAVDGTASGIDWDELREDAVAEPGRRRSLVPAMLLIGGLVAVVVLLAIVRLLAGRQDAGPQAPAEVGGAGGQVAAVGDPYAWSMVGCGGGWNPGIACEPFAAQPTRPGMADLVSVEKKEAYLGATIAPIDAWLLRDGGARQRLERRSEGGDIYVFAVRRHGDGWDQFWGDGEEFRATLVILPRGAELELSDEWSWLRREESLKLRAPPPPEVVEAGLPGGQARPGVAGTWAWKSGLDPEQASYDARKGTFESPLVLSGGENTAGAWTLVYRAERQGEVIAQRSYGDIAMGRVGVDVVRPLRLLMREAAVVASLQQKTGKEGATVWAGVRPPGSREELTVAIALRGEVVDVGVDHKVCAMIRATKGVELPDGKVALSGRARIGDGDMRPTFDPTAHDGKGECADGGGTGRWTTGSFGPGSTRLEFIYEGSEPTLRASADKLQHAELPDRWSRTEPSCLAITIYLGPDGSQAQAPKVEKLYDLVDGACK